MTSFRDQLTEASRAAAANGPVRTPWDEVLDEFTTWLEETYGGFMKASLRTGSHPDVRRVIVSPKGRRNESFSLLVVHVTDKVARVLGENTVELKSVDELKSYLTDFVRLPAFRSSLDELKSIAETPVTGALRADVERKARALLADVTVEVPADQQHRLADASEATPVQRIDELYVIPAGPTLLGRGSYSERAELYWLVAGGYALSIEHHARAPDGRIRLSGTPVPATSLD